MKGIARTLKLTLGSLALFIALTLASAPVTQSGLQIHGASAAPQIPTNDFSSKDYFKKFCGALGGMIDEGKDSIACLLPNGHGYICDKTAKNCSFWVKRPLNVGVTNVSNGTLTSTGTGGTGTTTTGVNRSTNSAVLDTRDR
jgi:hypothetical protein